MFSSDASGFVGSSVSSSEDGSDESSSVGVDDGVAVVVTVTVAVGCGDGTAGVEAAAVGAPVAEAVGFWSVGSSSLHAASGEARTSPATANTAVLRIRNWITLLDVKEDSTQPSPKRSAACGSIHLYHKF